MNVYIFSYRTIPISKFYENLVIPSNLFCSFFFWFVLRNIIQLLKIIQLMQFCSSSIFLSLKSQVRTCLKRLLKKKKVTWHCEHNLNNQFFYLTREKKYLCSEQLKQPFYSFIHSIMIETCYEDTTQATIF